MALFSLATVIILYREPLVLGGDEATEMSKAYLLSLRHKLYSEIWNDQPPLFTYILAGAFKLFGPGLSGGRIVASAFGAILLSACYLCVKRSSGVLGGIAAALWLYTARDCTALMHAAMLETPAVALAVASIAVLMTTGNSRSSWKACLISGGILGLGLQCKYTAVMVGVGAFLCVIYPVACEQEPVDTRRSWQRVLLWGAGALATFGAVAIWVPEVDYGAMLRSHTSHSQDGVDQLEAPRIDQFLSWDNILIVCGAVVSSVALGRRRQLVLPLIVLVETVFIQTIHRPWWYYYYLHTALPLAWLLGIFVGNLVRIAARANGEQWVAKSRVKGLLGGLTAAIILAGIASAAGSRFLEESWLINRIHTVGNSPEVRLLLAHKRVGDYIFTKHKEISFAAGIPPTPRLCVLAAKRYWTGELSEEVIREYLAVAHPRLLLLSRVELDDAWFKFVAQRCNLLAETEAMLLYEWR